MKDNGPRVYSTAKVFMYGPMDPVTMVVTSMVTNMGLENTSIVLKRYIKANGSKDFSMEEAPYQTKMAI